MRPSRAQSSTRRGGVPPRGCGSRRSTAPEASLGELLGADKEAERDQHMRGAGDALEDLSPRPCPTHGAQRQSPVWQRGRRGALPACTSARSRGHKPGGVGPRGRTSVSSTSPPSPRYAISSPCSWATTASGGTSPDRRSHGRRRPSGRAPRVDPRAEAELGGQDVPRPRRAPSAGLIACRSPSKRAATRRRRVPRVRLGAERQRLEERSRVLDKGDVPQPPPIGERNGRAVVELDTDPLARGGVRDKLARHPEVEDPPTEVCMHRLRAAPDTLHAGARAQQQGMLRGSFQQRWIGQGDAPQGCPSRPPAQVARHDLDFGKLRHAFSSRPSTLRPLCHAGASGSRARPPRARRRASVRRPGAGRPRRRARRRLRHARRWRHRRSGVGLPSDPGASPTYGSAHGGLAAVAAARGDWNAVARGWLSPTTRASRSRSRCSAARASYRVSSAAPRLHARGRRARPRGPDRLPGALRGAGGRATAGPPPSTLAAGACRQTPTTSDCGGAWAWR